MNAREEDWAFLDPPNTAVITNVRILDGTAWVHYVTHDEDDGAWQFHPASGQATMKEAAVTSLKRIVEIDPRIEELADLPLGWRRMARGRRSALDARVKEVGVRDLSV